MSPRCPECMRSAFDSRGRCKHCDFLSPEVADKIREMEYQVKRKMKRRKNMRIPKLLFLMAILTTPVFAIEVFEKPLIWLVDNSRVFKYEISKEKMRESIEFLEQLRKAGLTKKAEKFVSEIEKREKLRRISERKFRYFTPDDMMEFVKKEVLEFRQKNKIMALPCNPKKRHDEWDDRELKGESCEPFQEASYGWDGQGFRIAKIRTGKDEFQAFALEERELQEYPGLIPMDSLKKINEAIKKKLFDEIRIISLNKEYVDSTGKTDPIAVGVIEGVNHKFFITEWGNDVSIEDILPAA